jgi:regulator of RNase E activity RraA
MSSQIMRLPACSLAAGQLDALRRISSPTIANAVETFQVRERSVGVTCPGVRCLFPELGAMVGIACTAIIRSAQPPLQPRQVSRTEYWRYLKSAPAPVVNVVEDLSETPAGAYFGEVNARIHSSLGSVGVITNGTVRDVPEVSRTGLHFFAAGVQVSHGYAHLEEFNCPVKVFGMLVYPGDIVHADQHGAVVIPREIVSKIPEAAREIERKELAMLAACELPDPIPSLDELISAEY